MKKNKETWNSIFLSADPGEYYSAPMSQEMENIVERLPAGGSILDLGCGMARTSLQLCERGFEVTAVDFSETAIGILKDECLRRGLAPDVRHQDVCNFRFEADYDMIIAFGIFQFLPRDCWERLIRDIKNHTRIGGVNLVLVFTDAIPAPEDMADSMGDVFREGELFEIYHDWDIVIRESFVKEDEHPGGIRHRHPMNRLVAVKR
jgi:tellurite methyltransferase